MADFVKVIDNENRILWVNREFVTDVTYNKDNGNSKIQLCGGPDNHIIIHGGNLAAILFGVNENEKGTTIIEADKEATGNG